MLTGTIVKYNAKTKDGIVKCRLFGHTYPFRFGYVDDQRIFKPGLVVTFSLVPAWQTATLSASTYKAVNVQCATAAFSRYAASYDPDRHCMTMHDYIDSIRRTDKF